MTAIYVHSTPDAEMLVVDMARVSNPANQGNHDTAAPLLQYLIKHKHWSPFEMVSLCVKIHTERDIAAQILRHRSFSFQEYSQRYARTLPAEIPAQRLQDHKNRQNSIDGLPPGMQDYWAQRAGRLISDSYKLYDEMLREGLAKETARRILPLCTPTTLYMHGTLRSWIHYIELRSEAGTQLEHRQIANACCSIFIDRFPLISTALDWT
jgi:thymidylate synthase (FAD)